MRPINQWSRTQKNTVQSLLSTALLLLPVMTLKADDIDDQKNHLQQLIDQASSLEDSLGTDLVNAMSLGGVEFVTLGDKGSLLNGALDGAKLASNIGESADFISRLAGSTQSEESVAWCGRNAIVGFNDSGSFVRTMFPPSPSPSRSFSFDGWSVSSDAGASFTDRGILLSDPVPAGSRFLDLFGDPVVGCTDSATFYYASLATNTTFSGPPFVYSAISISKSTDGGQSFGGAKIAVQKSGPHMQDKDWMAVKRVSGADYIHITYTDFFVGAPCLGAGTSIEYVRSTDGGATFSSPIVIDRVCGSIPFVQGSHVAVGNGNDVYVAWEYYPNGMRAGRQIKLRKSTDGGTSFPAPAVVVSNVTVVGSGIYVQGFFRDFIDFQGLAVDTTGGSKSGNVYITWQDGRNLNQPDPFGMLGGGCLVGSAPGYCFGDILFTRSVDGGGTWSPPVRVNDDPISLKVDQMFPAVEVDKDGQLFVVFYDRRRDSRNFLIDTFVANSHNAGQTWDNQRVTTNNFAAIHGEDVVVNSVYMGDYVGIAADHVGQGDGVIVAWGDNSLGNPDVAKARVH
jgi:hypothetical protein